MLRSRLRTLTVFVRAYRRFRFMRWENVCAHYRSDPRQGVLF
jgi:hypothetical protein